MTRLDQVKHEIERMTFEEKAELISWMRSYEDDAWDRQMKRDAAEGRLDPLLDEVDRAIERDELEDMP